MAALAPEGRIPIIRLYDDLIVVVQGALTDRMVNQLQEDIPLALDRYDAKGVVISVAGIDIMDSYVSRMIFDVAVSSRLMGVETVVCGITALIAQTLVEMGMDMGSVPTVRNLERALELLAARRRARRDTEDDLAGDNQGQLDEGDEHGRTSSDGARAEGHGAGGREAG